MCFFGGGCYSDEDGDGDDCDAAFDLPDDRKIQSERRCRCSSVQRGILLTGRAVPGLPGPVANQPPNRVASSLCTAVSQC